MITEVKNLLEEYENNGVIRRHDSVIVFGSDSDFSFVNDFEYMDRKGWFGIDKKMPNIIPEYSEHIEAWE